MSGKRFWGLIGLLAISLGLVGCAGEPFAEAYTARGHLKDLETTDVFDTTENLQIAIQFNQHTAELRLETVWTDPAGTEAGTLQATIPTDAAIITVSFDLERAGRLYWQPGEWTVGIRIDGKLEKTLTFNVEGNIPDQAPQDTQSGSTETNGDNNGYDINNPTNPFGN